MIYRIPIPPFVLLLLLFLLLSGTAFAQGPPASVGIVAPRTSFTFGETLKLTAYVRDVAGAEIKNAVVVWNAVPPEAATVASDGTVTALRLDNFVVRAASGSVTSEVTLQALPKRIVLTPQRDVMTVGTVQLIRAQALDYFDKPIPNVTLRWNLSNLARGWDNNNPMATIDAFGQMRALVQGTLLVGATVDYPYFPGLLSQARGETSVTMRAVKTYDFDHIFTAETTKASSKLMPRSVQLLPTEDDGFVLSGSLDSTALALMKWRNGTLKNLMSSGRAHTQTGQPLIDFLGYAINHNGEMLTSEVDITGSTQLSDGPLEAQSALLVPGTPLIGAYRTYSFNIQRNSLADSAMKLILASYAQEETLLNANALYRGVGNSNGLSEQIVSTLDSLPGYPNEPFYFRYYGIAADGTAWFSTGVGSSQIKLVLWRQKPYQKIERVLGDSDAFQGSIVRNIANGGTGTSQTLFVASNGETVTTVDTANSSYFARWRPGTAEPQVLRGSTSGIYWHEPGVGTLISSNQNNRGNGLYLWTDTDVRPLLILGGDLDGGKITEIQSAASNSRGVTFAMVATTNNPMVIVRVLPDVQVVLRSDDVVPIAAPPVISGLLRPRGGQGFPFAIIGGQNGSIARVGADNTLQPVVSAGETIAAGRIFKGINSSQVRVLPNGDIVFADGNGIYRWSNDTYTLIQAYPISVAGSSLGTPSAIDVNSSGTIAGQWFSGTGTGIYILGGGVATKILRIGETVNGEAVTAVRQPAIDDAGRVLFSAFTENGNEYLVLWKQGTLSVVLSDGKAAPDGRTIRSHSQLVLASSDSFTAQITLTDGQTTFIRYRSSWELLAARNDRMPSGSYMLFGSLFTVNRNSDVTFFYNGGAFIQHLVAKRSGGFLEIQDWSELTDSGDLLFGLTSVVMNDDASVFALATNDDGQQVIYRGTPVRGVIEVPFTTKSTGGFSTTTAGSGANTTVGFARLESTVTTSGLAIFGNRQNGVLVSEAAVPATPAISSGRIYAELAGSVNTGVAVANPNDATAKISFYFTRSDGADGTTGTFTLAPNGQTAAFLDQAPFKSGPNFTGTFTFTSSVPVSVVALRGYVNTRSEFLLTTLPVTDLSLSPQTSTVTLPHFAAGGGWSTSILLVNPTSSALGGSVQFFSPGSGTTAGAPVSVLVAGAPNSQVPYSIPAKASVKLVVTGNATATTSGSVRVVPSSGAAVPASLAVFSFASGNTVVSEAGVAGVAGTFMQMYAESAGEPFSPKSIQSGLAIANPTNLQVSVLLELRRLDGSPAPVPSLTLSIPPNGQIGKFLGELFPDLDPPFQGVFRITSQTAISVTGLRARTNERGDFLITTTPAALPSAGLSSSDLYFPHIVDGGGYTTQFIVIGPGTGDQLGTIRFFSQSGEELPLPLQ